MAETYIDEYGYERFSDSGKRVSRYTAEKKLGRKLRQEEVVHHINNNKLDNRPSNLCVFSNQQEHENEHNHQRKERYVDYEYDYYDADNYNPKYPTRQTNFRERVYYKSSDSFFNEPGMLYNVNQGLKMILLVVAILIGLYVCPVLVLVALFFYIKYLLNKKPTIN